MSGKHGCECGCVECIAYMETNLQVDLDEWSYDVDFPGTVPSIRYSVGTATNSLTADTDRCIAYMETNLQYRTHSCPLIYDLCLP
jgi:hypothetical protein